MMLEHLRSLRFPMLAAVSGAALAMASDGVLAQRASPEIRAKEQNDPAIGETVIINRRKSSAAAEAAPNPYAPAAKPEPEQKPEAKDTARDSRLGRFASPVPARRPEPEQSAELPPLPEINRDVRSAAARPPLRPRNEADRDGDDRPPQRWARRDRDDWRDDDDRDYGYVARRGRLRPWRQCQRLAWRCEDGFERACVRWQRQC